MSLNSKLRRIAEQLPSNHPLKTVRKRVYGYQILEVQPNAKDSAGKPINAKNTYTVEVPATINHFKAMKELLAKAGKHKNPQPIIDEYVRGVFKSHGMDVRVEEVPNNQSK